MRNDLAAVLIACCHEPGARPDQDCFIQVRVSPDGRGRFVEAYYKGETVGMPEGIVVVP